MKWIKGRSRDRQEKNLVEQWNNVFCLCRQNSLLIICQQAAVLFGSVVLPIFVAIIDIWGEKKQYNDFSLFFFVNNRTNYVML